MSLLKGNVDKVIHMDGLGKRTEMMDKAEILISKPDLYRDTQGFLRTSKAATCTHPQVS